MITFFRKKQRASEKTRKHVFVSGRVQGVWFRESTKKKADKLGVFGWAKNLSDGRVEAIFEGEGDRVEDLVKWTKHGPIWAKVENTEIKEETYIGEFSDFSVRYDF